MKIVSIISEYNPFHYGHKYQIDKIRENGGTHIVAIMSGNAVQRGDIPIFNKHSRAKAAIENGVDLVIELPVPFSVASAEIFAKAGVYIASQISSNYLSFGAECEDENVLSTLAEISKSLSTDEYKSEITKNLQNGNNYPTALSKVIKEHFGEEYSKEIEKPNNILALEYLKAISNTNIKPMPILRKYTSHDSNITKDNFASASQIRKLILSGKDYKKYIPKSIDESVVCDIKYMERDILFTLLKMSREDLISLPDCNSTIADRIINSLKKATTLDELMTSVKTKSITMARIRRVIIYAILGIKPSDFSFIPYGRVLAFNERGAEVLKRVDTEKFDISTSLKELEDKNDNNKRLVRLDIISSEFLNLATEKSDIKTNEYTKQIKITKMKEAK